MNINPKVTAAACAAGVTTILAWVASLCGIEVPAEVQGAITTILVFAAGYFTPASGGSSGKHTA